MAFPALALNRADFANPFQLPLQARNPFLDAAPIHFQLRFPWAAGPDSAGLARKVGPHSGEARQQILQLRELNLEPPFPAPRPLCENVEDKLGAVEDLAREQIFQIASLRRRQFIVKNNRRDVLVLERFLDQLRLAFPNVIRRGRLL